MFNYDNVDELFKLASSFEKIEDRSTQLYSIKFLFGELDLARRSLASLKSKKQKLIPIENRIKMIKRTIATIASCLE